MSAIADAAGDLGTALRGIEGVRHYAEADAAAAVATPCTVLGYPAVQWDAPCSEPTSARFSVAVVADANDRAVAKLWELLPIVAAAIDAVTDAVVTQALPGDFQAGGHTLPAYLIEIEVSL